MAEEDLTIDIDVDYNGASAFAKFKKDVAGAIAATKSLQQANAAAFGGNGSGGTDMDRFLTRFDRNQSRMNKTLDRQTKILRRGLQPALTAVTTLFGLMTKALMPAVVGLGAFVAALAAAKVALVAVELAGRAFNYTMKGVAAGAATALGAVSMFTAAMSELRAVAEAPFVWGGTGITNQGLWAQLMGDPKLAMLGTEAIQNTTGSLMKMKVPVLELSRYMKELGDYGFYAGGGDAGAGITSIIEALKGAGTGSMTADSLKTIAEGFGQMGPAVEEAGKAFVGKDTQKFIDFLLSNPKELSQFNDGLDKMSMTMVGIFKSFKTVAQGTIDPFGQTLNNTVKGPLTAFRDRFIDILQRVMPSVVFFLGERMPQILDFLGEKLEGVGLWFVRTLNKVGEFNGGEGIAGFFRSIGDWWKKTKPILEKLAEAWDVIYSGIKPIIVALAGMFGRLTMAGASGISGAADKWKSTGESIAQVFRAGGPVEKTLMIVFEVAKVLAETIGPAIKSFITGMKSPMYIFDQIIENKSALKEFGESVGRAFAKTGPIWDLIGDIIGIIIRALPDVGRFFEKMVEAGSAIASALKPVLSVVSDIASKFKIIEGVIIYMISKAVIGKLAGGLGAVGTALGSTGIASAGGKLGAALGGARGMVGLAAGGMAISGALSGDNSLGSIIQTAVSAAVAGAMIGGVPGALIGAAGAVITQALVSAIQQDKDVVTTTQQMQLTQLASGFDTTGNEAFLNSYLSATRAINKYDETDVANDALRQAVNDIASPMYAMNEQLKKNTDMFMRTSFDVASQTTTMTGVTGKTYSSTIADFSNTRSAEFYRENAMEVARLADEAGVNLMDGALSVEEGLDMLNAAAERMRPIGSIFADKMETYVYGPIRKAAWDKRMETAAVDIMAQIQSSGYDPSIVQDYTIGIMENIIGQINSGLMTAAEGKKAGEIELDALINDLKVQAYMYGTAGDTVNHAAALAALAEAETAKNQWANVTDAAARAAEEQQAKFDQMAEGIASAVGSSLGTAVSDANSGMYTLLNRVRQLSNIRLRVSADGRVSVSTLPQGRETGENDTPTPRFGSLPIGDRASALFNTRNAHLMVDGGIGGRRTVTSMWRNTNLGSGNSDHVTGRALDLVGDNLVSYAAKMREMGGFAEFHGSGSGRHLHVVPPQLPTGDRPRPMAPVNVPSQPQVQNFNTTVNPSPRMNEEMLARKTVRALAAAQQNRDERR